MTLKCPKCDADVNVRMVAESKQGVAGLVRRRYCQCGACVTTIERVLAADFDGILVENLSKGPGRGRGPGSDLSLIRMLVKRLGGVVTELKL
jgi:hypothetical protein